MLAGAPRTKLEHPSSAFAALRHLLPQGEKGPPRRGEGEPLHCSRQSPPFEINRSADIAPLLLPLVGEGGRAGAKRRRGRMRGAGRSAARQAGTPLIRLRCAQAPSPTRGEGAAPPGRRGNRFIATGQSPPFEINRSADIAPLLLPRVGEGGRAGAKRRRGRMRGAGRSAARQAGTPPSVPLPATG